MPSAIRPLEEQAIELAAPRKFHQIFTLPATQSHGPLKVTYAISGKEDGEDTPTIMFCGGMFGSRWQTLTHNWLAEKEGVRIIFIDRPGFGGSTKVPIQQRISVFLEVVPALLAHLNIKHISIVSHSAGTIYALNLLATHPELLSPMNPSLTLLSPWVHQSLSGTTFLSAAAMLPNSVLNHWSNLTGFIINNAAPTFTASGGALSSIGSLWSGKSKVEKHHEEEKRVLEAYGLGLDGKKELDKVMMKYAFVEECTGGNDEARLCLKSIEGTTWGAIEDYPSFIKVLGETWEKIVEGGKEKLRLRVFFSEEDIMIGEKGREYLLNCLTGDKCGKGIDLETAIIEGTDHDSIVDPSKGVMTKIYAALNDSKLSLT